MSGEGISGEWAELGRLGNFLGFRFRRMQDQLTKAFSSATAAHNLKSGSFSSLALISANPGLSQQDLCREVGLDKSVTVLMVNDLESRGLAVRKKSKQDKRRHALFITPAGEAFLAELFEILNEVEGGLMSVLSPEELAMLKGLMDRIYHFERARQGEQG